MPLPASDTFSSLHINICSLPKHFEDIRISSQIALVFFLLLLFLKPNYIGLILIYSIYQTTVCVFIFSHKERKVGGRFGLYIRQKFKLRTDLQSSSDNEQSDRMWCKVLVFQPIDHVSVSPTDGIGPTQGQRKTLTRVGIEPTTFGFDHRCSTDWSGQTGADRGK